LYKKIYKIMTHTPNSSNHQSLLIIIPTYNEVSNVPEIIKMIEATISNAHILFVDDGSEDGTAHFIKNHSEFLRKIFIIEREKKLGLGTAYITGFKWGLKNKYDAICQMDADLSHNPIYLPKMLTLLSKYDLVIGSRYVQDGGVENWGIIRKFISRFGSIYARFILSLPIKDLTGGYNLWKAHTLQTIISKKIRSEGYSFQIELKYRAFQKNFKIKEFPIFFKDRIVGQSKMSFKIFIEAFYRVIQIRFRS